MTVPVWITPISMVVYTVLLMLLTEFMRRHYRTSMWVWVVSLVTIPLWIINIPGDDWFRWAKNLSVILPLIFAGLGRIAAVQQKDTPFWRLMRNAGCAGRCTASCSATLPRPRCATCRWAT